MIEFPLLTPEDIEVKVKQVTKAGALLLLYKTARTDAKILDQAVGPLNWTDEYLEVKGNLYCRLGIRESEDKPFVYKMDCGVESGQDDGQEKKAECSDSFKRAATKLGIGRELYTSPQIWANVSTVQKGDKWFLEDKYAKYIVTHVVYNETTRVITELEISNASSGIKVFSWKMPTTGAMAKKMTKTMADKDPVVEETTSSVETSVQETKKAAKKVAEPVIETKNIVEEEKMPLKQLITEIGNMVKHMYEKEGGADNYNTIVAKVTNGAGFKCNTATEEQYDIVLAIYDQLIAAGYGA